MALHVILPIILSIMQWILSVASQRVYLVGWLLDSPMVNWNGTGAHNTTTGPTGPNGLGNTTADSSVTAEFTSHFSASSDLVPPTLVMGAAWTLWFCGFVAFWLMVFNVARICIRSIQYHRGVFILQAAITGFLASLATVGGILLSISISTVCVSGSCALYYIGTTMAFISAALFGASSMFFGFLVLKFQPEYAAENIQPTVTKQAQGNATQYPPV